MSTDTSREDMRRHRLDRCERFPALGYAVAMFEPSLCWVTQTEEFCRKCQGSTGRKPLPTENKVTTRKDTSEVRNMTVRKSTRKIINIPQKGIFIRPA